MYLLSLKNTSESKYDARTKEDGKLASIRTLYDNYLYWDN